MPTPSFQDLGAVCMLFILLPCLVSYRRTSSNRKCLLSSALGAGEGGLTSASSQCNLSKSSVRWGW